jgi:low affinity Fe/Cu permease
VHAILRRGASRLAALAAGSLALMVCVAVFVWADSGPVMPHTSPVMPKFG